MKKTKLSFLNKYVGNESNIEYLKVWQPKISVSLKFVYDICIDRFTFYNARKLWDVREDSGMHPNICWARCVYSLHSNSVNANEIVDWYVFINLGFDSDIRKISRKNSTFKFVFSFFHNKYKTIVNFLFKNAR